MEDKERIILFDGVCNLCNNWVKFVIQRDPNGLFKFAPLQSEIGKQLQVSYGIDNDHIDSIVLIENGKAYTMSTAALRICSQLYGMIRFAKVFLFIPSFIRNVVYRTVAANRYRWFGKQDACMLPTSNIKKRFLSKL